jgi:hypothetical protein
MPAGGPSEPVTTGSDPATRTGVTWRLQAVRGHGWLREWDQAGPIVTGDQREAHQFPTEAAALEAAQRLGRDRVPMLAVAGEATAYFMRGD